MNLFRQPINCYRRNNRYISLIILHIIDAVTFTVRFSLVCIDLSRAQEEPPNVAFPVLIFLIELVASLPLVFFDIIYGVVTCLDKELFRDERHPVCCRRRTALRIATMTCLPCDCYAEHPAGMHLTRLGILTSCYMLRFVAFILGASCATSFNPRCVPYAVLSSLSLVPSLFTLILEWFHFHLLWHFQPDIENGLSERRDRSHLRFLFDGIINSERSKGWRLTLCDKDTTCQSKSLHHILLYHFSLAASRDSFPSLKDDETIVAYFATNNETAIRIAQDGFDVDRHRKVADSIVFRRTVSSWNRYGADHDTAIICVRLSVGRVFKTKHLSEFNFSHPNIRSLDPPVQTLYYSSAEAIKVLHPGQIENWIVILRTRDNDLIDAEHYDGCI